MNVFAGYLVSRLFIKNRSSGKDKKKNNLIITWSLLNEENDMNMKRNIKEIMMQLTTSWNMEMESPRKRAKIRETFQKTHNRLWLWKYVEGEGKESGYENG